MTGKIIESLMFTCKRIILASHSAESFKDSEITLIVVGEHLLSSTLFLIMCDATATAKCRPINPNYEKVPTINKNLHTAGLRYLEFPNKKYMKIIAHQHRNHCLAYSVCLNVRPRCEAQQLLTDQSTHNKRDQPSEPKRGPIAYAHDTVLVSVER